MARAWRPLWASACFFEAAKMAQSFPEVSPQGFAARNLDGLVAPSQLSCEEASAQPLHQYNWRALIGRLRILLVAKEGCNTLGGKIFRVHYAAGTVVR
jgi:hypothetical protein